MSVLDDDLDYQILTLLQKDGRMSFTEISKEINVAVSTIRHRYINLIETGTLQIIGRVDPNKIGFNAYASILISVKPKSFMNSILTSLTKLPEISFLASVSGDYDVEM
jgi:Lrp/AsnC family transcriptional regulator for asnA, asnC and gidA